MLKIKLSFNNWYPQSSLSTCGCSNGLVPTQNNSCNLNLPKLSLKTFSGHYHERPLFKSMYGAMQYVLKVLSDMEKFQYLMWTNISAWSDQKDPGQKMSPTSCAYSNSIQGSLNLMFTEKRRYRSIILSLQF